jgi:aspartyl-tRNA(Asn)/glutamyl-tRNA(Gln) amidotransferase subunit A
MSDEICMMSAADLVAGYRAGALSPVEAARAALDRIDRYDGTLNAFIIVCREEALDSARHSEARWRRAAPRRWARSTACRRRSRTS